jgi:nucleoside-diphosphate-sugar epimerase
MVVPDEEIFRGNSMATYNVVEAASRLGIKRIVIAGSITVYGVTYAEGDVYYPSFPVEETTDANPMDAYAISKVCGERIARGFTRRYGSDIYVLRIERIVAPEEYKGELFRSYIQAPEKWGVHGWAYIDARGVGQMCELAVSKAGLGFQIFNAVNDEIANYMPTAEFLSRVCPEVPFHERGGHQRVPYQQQEDQGDAWIPRKTSLDAILRSIGNA